MSEIDVRDLQCENCRKFSHCNNNELVCIKKFQRLKAENEELQYKLAGTERRLVELGKANTHNLVLLQRCKECLDEIYDICSNNLSVKLLFKDRMDLAIFIRKRIKEVNKSNG